MRQLERHLNLVWIYQPSESETQAISDVVTQNNDPSTQLITPPPEVLRELLTLAKKGNFNAIIKCADQLEAEDTNLATFAHQLRQLARQFDEDVILEFLTQYEVEMA